MVTRFSLMIRGGFAGFGSCTVPMSMVSLGAMDTDLILSTPHFRLRSSAPASRFAGAGPSKSHFLIRRALPGSAISTPMNRSTGLGFIRDASREVWICMRPSVFTKLSLGSLPLQYRSGCPGEPCVQCLAVGTAPNGAVPLIIREVVGGRGTYFCPECQQLPAAT
ncbi:MAG: hypothetical protein EBT22_03495 [Chloroflexi bacterium]|nr:hypothetical protein [Chloroflexota bacterium]